MENLHSWKTSFLSASLKFPISLKSHRKEERTRGTSLWGGPRLVVGPEGFAGLGPAGKWFAGLVRVALCVVLGRQPFGLLAVR